MALHRQRLFAFALVALIVGCGGGSSGTTAFPSTGPTVAPAAGSSTIPITPSSSTASLPPAGGYTGMLALTGGTVPAGTTAIVGTSAQLPPNAPVLQSGLRHPSSATADSALLFVQLQFSNGVTLSGSPGFTFTLPASVDPKAGPFYMAFFNPANVPATWQLAVEGPGSVTGSSVSFPATSSSITFAANIGYAYALYQVPGTTPATGVAFSPAAIPFVADQGAQSGSLGLSVTSAGGAAISGAFSIPVTVSVAATGSHMKLSLDGGVTKSASLVLHSSSDASNAKFYYDGNAATGYSATVSAVAPIAGSAKLNALTVVGAPGYAALVLGINANHNATFTVNESNFSGTFTNANTCTSAAVVSNPVQTGASAQFTVTGGVVTANCTITIGDGIISYPVITVQNTVNGSTPVPLPTPTTPTGSVAPSSSPVPLPTSSGTGGIGGGSPTPLPLPT